MAAGVNGYVDIATGLLRYKIRLEYSETYDVASNTSALTIKPYLFPSSPPYVDAYPDLTISVAGTPVISTDSASGNYRVDWMGAAQPYPILKNGAALSGRITGLAHNENGTLSVNLKISGHTHSDAMVYFGDSTAMSANGSATIALTNIPRATPISASASSVNMGTSVTFSMPRYVSNYTHRVSYAFGGASGVIATSAGTSLNWTPPVSLAAQIPTATSGACTITCQTYNGSSLIGSSSVIITLNVPSSVKPTVSSTQIRNIAGSSVIMGWGLSGFTQGYSRLLVAATLTAQYSVISEYTISYGLGTFTGRPGVETYDASHTSGTLNTPGTYAVTITVKDARGRSTKATIASDYTVHAYSAPTVSDTVAQRYSTDPALKDDDGSNLAVRGTATCSSVGGNNSIDRFRFRYKERSATAWSVWFNLTSGVFSTILNALATTESYLVEIVVADKLTTATPVRIIVATAQTTINAKPGGRAVAFGVYATTENSVEIAPNWTLIMSDNDSGGTVTLTATQLKRLLALLE